MKANSSAPHAPLTNGHLAELLQKEKMSGSVKWCVHATSLRKCTVEQCALVRCASCSLRPSPRREQCFRLASARRHRAHPARRHASAKSVCRPDTIRGSARILGPTRAGLHAARLFKIPSSTRSSAARRKRCACQTSCARAALQTPFLASAKENVRWKRTRKASRAQGEVVQRSAAQDAHRLSL